MNLTDEGFAVYYEKHATHYQKHTLNIIATIVYVLVRAITLGREAPNNAVDAVKKHYHHHFFKSHNS